MNTLQIYGRENEKSLEKVRNFSFSILADTMILFRISSTPRNFAVPLGWVGALNQNSFPLQNIAIPRGFTKNYY